MDKNRDHINILQYICFFPEIQVGAIAPTRHHEGTPLIMSHWNFFTAMLLHIVLLNTYLKVQEVEDWLRIFSVPLDNQLEICLYQK